MSKDKSWQKLAGKNWSPLCVLSIPWGLKQKEKIKYFIWFKIILFVSPRYYFFQRWSICFYLCCCHYTSPPGYSSKYFLTIDNFLHNGWLIYSVPDCSLITLYFSQTMTRLPDIGIITCHQSSLSGWMNFDWTLRNVFFQWVTCINNVIWSRQFMFCVHSLVG